MKNKLPSRNVNVFARGPLLAALLSLLAMTAPAATIHVPADQPTIQQAINAASNGDLILVSPGTYLERINYQNKIITIQSTGGPEQTIIDGNNAGTVVTFGFGTTAQSVLTGFTIQHGSASFGAGVSVSGSPTISRNIFRDNAQGAGGSGAAIDGNSSSPFIEGNTFLANTCDGQFASGVVSFANTSSPRIINNIFRQNPCRAINMTLPEGNHPVIANNTIVQNNGGILVDARVPTSTQIYANNILIGNTVGLLVDFLSPGHEPTWTNNLVFNNTTNYSGIADQTGLNGNISSDPRFVPTPNNFQLQPDSPAIDAGTLSVPGLPATDFGGRRRVVNGDGSDGALPDIGAYEFGPPPVTLGNISTRLRVETGDNVLIGGFIIAGTQSKKVIVRALGPSAPVSGTLANPILELRDSSGGLIRSNDDWRIGGQEAEIMATGLQPGNDLESAIVETLPANGSSYTAIVRGTSSGTGVGLIEAYDLDRTVDANLANISTRGLVQTDDDIMIAGTIVVGPGSQRVLVRAIGPSVPVPGALSDPTLELRDSNGMLIRANDNWRSDQEAEIIGTGLQPTNNQESAILETVLGNGTAYTAIVRGVGNATGVALVEVYGLD
jgi:hypothetical protein